MLPWLLKATPDFWTAVCTFGLLVVATVTAIVGLRALRTANDTLQLETAPYLVVTEVFTAPSPKNDLYVITSSGNAAAHATLREWISDDVAVRRSATGGFPSWSELHLAVKNVGRSPAVGAKITAAFRLQPTSVSTIETLSNDSWKPGRDYPLALNADSGSGTIALPAIMPGETIHTIIQNRYAGDLYLRLRDQGSTLAANGSKRMSIRVHTPAEPFEIAFRRIF